MSLADVLHRERHQGLPCNRSDCWEADKATEHAAAVREWLLSEQTIDAATKGMQHLSATNRDRYPGDNAYARAALTEALDQGDQQP